MCYNIALFNQLSYAGTNRIRYEGQNLVILSQPLKRSPPSDYVFSSYTNILE